jgi:hypothetical protein
MRMFFLTVMRIFLLAAMHIFFLASTDRHWSLGWKKYNFRYFNA